MPVINAAKGTDYSVVVEGKASGYATICMLITWTKVNREGLAYNGYSNHSIVHIIAVMTVLWWRLPATYLYKQ